MRYRQKKIKVEVLLLKGILGAMENTHTHMVFVSFFLQVNSPVIFTVIISSISMVRETQLSSFF